MNEDRFKAYKKIRKTWGVVKPETKILKSEKVYNRNKDKQNIRKIIEDNNE